METPAFKLDGKAAIVTGAASGIGRAIATTLGAAGAAVCVGDLDEEGSRRVAGEIERSGGRAIAVRADVSRADQVEDMVRATAEAFGVLYLCSEAAAGITGAAYSIDGGWTAR